MNAERAQEAGGYNFANVVEAVSLIQPMDIVAVLCMLSVCVYVVLVCSSGHFARLHVAAITRDRSLCYGLVLLIILLIDASL